MSWSNLVRRVSFAINYFRDNHRSLLLGAWQGLAQLRQTNNRRACLLGFAVWLLALSLLPSPASMWRITERDSSGDVQRVFYLPHDDSRADVIRQGIALAAEATKAKLPAEYYAAQWQAELAGFYLAKHAERTQTAAEATSDGRPTLARQTAPRVAQQPNVPDPPSLSQTIKLDDTNMVSQTSYVVPVIDAEQVPQTNSPDNSSADNVPSSTKWVAYWTGQKQQAELSMQRLRASQRSFPAVFATLEMESVAGKQRSVWVMMCALTVAVFLGLWAQQRKWLVFSFAKTTARLPLYARTQVMIPANWVSNRRRWNLRIVREWSIEVCLLGGIAALLLRIL